MEKCEKWGLFELSRPGRRNGNPYLDRHIRATFRHEQEEKTVEGFYDGDGVYRVRFMPSFEGEYSYRISGDFADEISEPEGVFSVGPPSPGNHGPVRADGIRLCYADGTRYDSIGTTCYAWAVQPLPLQEQTLETLSRSPFNKLRFCVFPKYYAYNIREPLTLPFERGHGEGLDPDLVETAGQSALSFPGMKAAPFDLELDYTRPNPQHFQRYDLRIRQLMELGIEADLILMHPYDRWGMNQMSLGSSVQYLRYMAARYGAFRNVWWSLANEYDLVFSRRPEDWELFGKTIAGSDPYRHLLSVHNCFQPYDFSKAWVTHCSLQRTDFYLTTETTDQYIAQYGKPVVWDEICYEGNLSYGWGNITAQELVRRFWEGTLRGGYCGHGETYQDPDDVIWWSHGGILKGESPARLSFLREILEDVPGYGLLKGQGSFDEVVGYSGGHCGEGSIICYDYSIHYLGIMRPASRVLDLPEDGRWQVELIDTWDMTITPLGVMTGFNIVPMPEKQYLALRIRKI